MAVILAIIYTLLDGDEQESRVLGDIYAMLGALGYGINTTVNEFIMRRGVDTWQILPRLATFEVVFGLILALSLEMKDYKTTPAGAFGMFVAYGVAMVCFYAIQMFTIDRASAVFLNVSVLLTNFYTLVFSLAVFQTQFSVIQIIPALLLLVSVYLYNYFEGEKGRLQEEEKEKSRKEFV